MFIMIMITLQNIKVIRIHKQRNVMYDYHSMQLSFIVIIIINTTTKYNLLQIDIISYDIFKVFFHLQMKIRIFLLPLIMKIRIFICVFSQGFCDVTADSYYEIL